MKIKYLLIIWLCFAGIISVFSQTEDKNYIVSRTYTLSSTDIEEIKYFDGLGNPIEILNRKAANAEKDLITLIEYDSRMRDSVIWLPGLSPYDGNMYYADGLKASSKTINNNQYPYSGIKYEAATVNRVTGEYNPGGDHLSGKIRKIEYLSNNGTTGALACARYEITGSGVSTKFKRTGFYTNKTLSVTKYTNEQGDISYDFKNKLGQTLLFRQINNSKNHDTYYIYDRFGRKCVVLSPMLSDKLTSTTTEWNESNVDVNNFAYLYKYDKKGNCVMKKLPGADWIYYVYDKANQLILVQDGEQRLKNEWSFTIPDIHKRTVLTGICKNTGITYTSLENVAVLATPNLNSSTYKYYSISNFTPSSPTLHSVAYYDNYNFASKSEFSGLGYDSGKAIFNKRYGINSDAVKHKGLLTGIMTAILDGSGSFIRAVMYYDDQQRLIQTQSTSHLSGGREKEYIAYNFIGKVTNKETVHMATGKTTQTEKYAYTYDHAFRLTSKTHQLNSNAVVELEKNTYDDLGRVTRKTIINRPYMNFDYTYNVRSQIKSMTNTFFRYNMYYNESFAGSTPRYDGGISAATYWAGGDYMAYTHGYTYKYDSLSRLTSALFVFNGVLADNYKVPRISYDKNGNISYIERWGKNSSGWTWGLIDKLSLAYTGNQLKTVTETAGNIIIAESADFKNYNTTNVIEYIFNKNGAMEKDLNKGISNIQYNFLNLPRIIDIKNPLGEARNEYVYSAGGTKLKVIHKWNSNYSTTPTIGSAISTSSLNKQKTTEYVSNKIYEDGVLKRILIDGGYIEDGAYNYYIKDHQGNNRVVTRDGGGIHQRVHYYPFGMPHADSPQANHGLQPYKYSDKELDQMHGLNLYDFSARMLDHTTGRFMTIDPLAEKYYSVSPYAYCANNPIKYIDPTGMTHYSMDIRGYVSVIMGTNGIPAGSGEAYDVLFTGNHSTIVFDKKLLSQLMEVGRNGYNGSYAETLSRMDAFNVFYHGANHTIVEWGLDGYRTRSGDMYVVRTSHSRDYVASSTTIPGYSEFDLTFTMHSHPDYDAIKGASTILEGNDMKNITDRYKRFLDAGMKHPDYWFKKDGKWTAFPKHYIYHPDSKNLYNYTPWNNSIFIRSTNDASDLYRNLGL